MSKRNNRIGRNEPCPCGSGKKYKRCHGNINGSIPAEGVISKLTKLHEAKDLLRRSQQGHGKPIISTEFSGHRVVAVGNKLHFDKSAKTFIDFLGNYIKQVIGSSWGNDEIKKPLDGRHQILKWYDEICRYQRKASVKNGELYSSNMVGVINAYYGLAYNLYLLQHNVEIQKHLIQRLKRKESFHGAYYESFVAAWFILAGFELKLENEKDPTVTHCEFTATKEGKIFSVEAKTRQPNKNHFDVGNQLYKALKKEAAHPRVVFIDLNIEKDFNPDKLETGVMSSICGKEESLKIDGEPAPPAYVFITNQPYHLHLMGEVISRMCFSFGFKINDFGHNTEFCNLIDAYKARQKHKTIDSVQLAFGSYTIPETFDGEISEFAFGDAERRFIIGERYELSDGIFGTLNTGIVIKDKKHAYLIFNTDNGQVVTSISKLTEAEFSAFLKHPDTFFGQVVKHENNIDDPVDMFEFFLESYRETPRDKLLELMKSDPDMEKLSKLSDDDLRLRLAEGYTSSIMNKKV